MIEPVIIDFAARGVLDVSRAFESVEQRMVRFERTTTASGKREARSRVDVAKREAADKEREHQKLTRDLERMDRALTRTTEREAKTRAKAQEKASALAHREEEKAAKAAAREVERLEAWKMRVRIRSSEMASRAVVRGIQEEERERERAEKRHHREHLQHQRHAAHSAHHFTERWGERFAGIGETIGVTAGFAGAFGVAEIARERLQSQRIADQLAILGGPGASSSALLGLAGEVGVATGTNKNDLLRAQKSYVEGTRDFAGGTDKENLEFIAKLGKTTGRDVGEIAGLAATLKRENGALSGEELRTTILAAMSPGSFGRASPGDVASMVAKFGKDRGAFAGDPGEVMKQLLGIGQLAFEGAGTAKGAASAVNSLGEVLGHDKKIWQMKSLGVKFDKTGRIESPEQMLSAIVKGTGGNVARIAEAVGPNAIPLFAPLADTYRKAEAGHKGSGAEAVRQQIATSIGQQSSEGQVNADFARIMNSAPEKFDRAVTKVKEAVEEKLAPWLERLADRIPELVPKIEKTVDALGEFADWFAKNPMQGIGATVLALVTKDVASAAIGRGIEAAVTKSVAVMPTGPIAAAIAAAIAGAAVGKASVDYLSDINLGNQRSVVSRTNARVNVASDLSARARAGKVTAADVKAVQAVKAQSDSDIEGFVATHGSRGPNGKVYDAEDAGQLKQLQQASDMLTKALERATKALDGMGGAAGTVANNPSRNGPMPSRADPRHT